MQKLVLQFFQVSLPLNSYRLWKSQIYIITINVQYVLLVLDIKTKLAVSLQSAPQSTVQMLKMGDFRKKLKTNLENNNKFLKSKKIISIKMVANITNTSGKRQYILGLDYIPRFLFIIYAVH